MKKWFMNCKTKQEAKKLFRQLVLKNHPDVGGDEKTMIAIIAEYEVIYRSLPSESNPQANETHTQYDSDKDFKMTQAMVDILNKINHLPDINIELIGVWLWVGGNTKPVKDVLKKAGFTWHSKKELWYWKEAENKFKGKSNVDMSVIRAVYGCEEVERVRYQNIG
jgi:hypothetical protein